MTAPRNRPIPDDVLVRFAAYFQEHVTWGSLHIVLDDGNVRDSDVAFCQQYALECGDTEGAFLADVLPGMLLLGLGAGIALNPMLLAAMNDVDQGDAGLASGVVNTSFMMGGALGLAVLASLAAARTSFLLERGVAQAAALNGGYQLAFALGAACGAVAALLCALLLRPPVRDRAAGPAPAA